MAARRWIAYDFGGPEALQEVVIDLPAPSRRRADRRRSMTARISEIQQGSGQARDAHAI
jgi:hypothetical protein